MRDIELYRAILGVTAPWRVVSVDLDVKRPEVVVRVDAGAGPFPCPECQAEVPGYDRKPRRWRHKVRRQEHRALKQADDARLTGTKYLWLMRPEDMTPEQRTTFRALQGTDLKVAQAWSLKERFRQFWGYTYLGAARKFFARWFWWATHSRLKPMAEVAKLIRRHLPNVLTYLRHGITNAGLEAVNATIQWVKKTARGLRNPEHFKTAIYFHCGGLDLYPHESR